VVAHAGGHEAAGHAKFEVLGAAHGCGIGQRLAGAIERERVAALERALRIVRPQGGGLRRERSRPALGEQPLGVLQPGGRRERPGAPLCDTALAGLAAVAATLRGSTFSANRSCCWIRSARRRAVTARSSRAC
jgi:hypothetical protein